MCSVGALIQLSLQQNATTSSTATPTTTPTKTTTTGSLTCNEYIYGQTASQKNGCGIMYGKCLK